MKHYLLAFSKVFFFLNDALMLYITMKVNGLFLLLLLLLSSLSTSIDKLDVGRFNQHVGGEY